MTCIGFDKFEGTCENEAGSSHSHLWCQRCDDLRMVHLDRRFDQIHGFGIPARAVEKEKLGEVEADEAG